MILLFSIFNTPRTSALLSQSKDTIVRLFVINSHGKILLLKDEHLPDLKQWVVPQATIKTNELKNKQEATLKNILNKITNIDSINISRLNPNDSKKDFLILAKDQEVILSDKKTNNYSEYIWITEENIKNNIPNNLYLTKNQLVKIFATKDIISNIKKIPPPAKESSSLEINRFYHKPFKENSNSKKN